MMSDQLPDGWEWAKLGDIAELVGGGTPSREHPEYFTGDIVWLTPTEIPKNRITVVSTSKERITQEGLRKSSARVLPKGSVLMTSRASIGYVAIADTEVTTNQGFASFICSNRVFNYYLAYWLFGTADFFIQEATGTTFKEITKSKLRNYSIPLPPLAEQERIVAKIEALFSQLDAGVAALRRIQAALKRYKASVLKAACEGRLVAQDPADEPAEALLRRLGKAPLVDDDLPALPEGWCWTIVGDVGEVITGTTPPKKDLDNYGSFIPFVKPPELRDGPITEAQDNLSEKGAKKARILPKDSVLVSCIGIIGKTGVNRIPVAFNQQINGIVFGEMVEALFGFYYFQSRKAREWLNEQASATTVAIINKSKFSQAPIPLPPRQEQKRIIAEVEQRLSVAAEVEAVVAALLARSARLRQAILKQAFEGKLV